jgi:nucleotide-binding universal stress UspA family protein
MFEKILLPLDGSVLAEEAIPYAEEMATRIGSAITLIHVCSPKDKESHNMHRLYIEKMADIMQNRLKEKVKSEHFIGDLAGKICDYVNQNDIGLVIMTAHGRSKLRVRLMGNRVDGIFRLVNCPTMLIQTVDTRTTRCAGGCIHNIMLSLDGTETGETALPIAEELAKGLGAKLTLFQMAKESQYTKSDNDIIGDTGLKDDELNAAEIERVKAYLGIIKEKLQSKGIETTSIVTLGTDPAKASTKAAKESEADLQVMASRGHLPVTAWAPNSIAHKLLNTSDIPLMVVKSS